MNDFLEKQKTSQNFKSTALSMPFLENIKLVHQERKCKNSFIKYRVDIDFYYYDLNYLNFCNLL